MRRAGDVLRSCANARWTEAAMLLRKPPWWCPAMLIGSAFLIASCSSPPPFKIHNGTDGAVVLVGCAQESQMDHPIPAEGTFTFGDSVGDRTLSDDPGFACVLKTSNGELKCLALPTDQSEKSDFDVADAETTDSFAACVAKSDPH